MRNSLTDEIFRETNPLATFFAFIIADIVKCNHKGKYTPVFVLDHSPIHKFMAKDALNASAMNVNPGGAQPKMRDGYFYR